ALFPFLKVFGGAGVFLKNTPAPPKNFKKGNKAGWDVGMWGILPLCDGKNIIRSEFCANFIEKDVDNDKGIV
ncbi:MAG: hypothetical protein LUH54_03625, partial [Firmicutes bacterium]|nr:hypothetical protein [Bacillota bacterium]